MTANAFRALHAPGELLLLANAWDAGSARLIESVGATAIATTSCGVAWAQGYPDGDVLPVERLLAVVGSIARVVRVPLTVDVEGGYSDDPAAVADLVERLVDAGAAGINLEDGAGLPEALAGKIAAIKTRLGPRIFINARTDVWLRKLVGEDARVAEAISRARRYRDAGADGLFVPGLADPAQIATVVAATDLPLNLMAVPGVPNVATLRELGVRRLSAGGAIAEGALGAARNLAQAFLNAGDFAGLRNGAGLGYAEMNALFA